MAHYVKDNPYNHMPSVTEPLLPEMEVAHYHAQKRNTGISRLVGFFGPQATELIEDWFSTKVVIFILGIYNFVCTHPCRRRKSRRRELWRLCWWNDKEYYMKEKKNILLQCRFSSLNNRMLEFSMYCCRVFSTVQQWIRSVGT